MSDPDPGQQLPSIPARWSEPSTVIAGGIAVWVIATIVVLVGGDRWSSALPTCWTGIAVGCLGFALFAAQRRSARRGDKGAQRGLV
ncbi:hypothetical protein GCM10007304_40340 [Rhodococcoides trifolii]|uniref:DUF2530 domain-containing protein n=1 Tax=Rhodococcoides trifolii TaxID=908250 RepID=A0A917LGV5_9NOCA|nr:DUF2530 domain-containing protein [Rhodococcus trifolii]GGG22464.1 hypothetical protein GCM10007304_40340 [Rhodococcus trifolii]